MSVFRFFFLLFASVEILHKINILLHLTVNYGNIQKKRKSVNEVQVKHRRALAHTHTHEHTIFTSIVLTFLKYGSAKNIGSIGVERCIFPSDLTVSSINHELKQTIIYIYIKEIYITMHCSMHYLFWIKLYSIDRNNVY